MEVKSEVFNQDCMEVMKRYPDKYFDLAIVDPPYGININVSMGRRKGEKKSKYHKFAGNDNSIPSKDYFIELFRVSKNQIIWGGNYFSNQLPVNSAWIFWDKCVSNDVSFGAGELAWTSFGISIKKINLCYSGFIGSDIIRIHPTQKPVALYKWLLDKYANKGDKILDTHLGSGSSRIAAHSYGYSFVGCELDKDYFDAQEKRFKDYTSQLTIF